jgi:hypothetical protein
MKELEQESRQAMAQCQKKVLDEGTDSITCIQSPGRIDTSLSTLSAPLDGSPDMTRTMEAASAGELGLAGEEEEGGG